MNRISRVPRIAWILSLVFGTSVFLPSFLGIDGMKGGYALSVLFGFMGMVSVITALVYGRLNKEQRAMLNEKDVLVRWRYSNEEWMTFTEKDYEEDKSSKKTLFYIISGWAIFFGIIFPVFDPEYGFYVTFMMIGLIVLIGITALISIRMAHQKNIKNKDEVVISMNGVYMSGQMYSWTMIGTKLLGAEYRRSTGISFIEFEYLSGQNPYSLRVPVPKGEEEKAKNILEILKRLI